MIDRIYTRLGLKQQTKDPSVVVGPRTAAEATKELSRAELKAMTSTQRGLYGLRKGLKSGLKEGQAFNALMIGVQIATCERGEVPAALMSGLTSTVTFAISSAMIEGALLAIPGVNVGVASFMAMGLAIPPDMLISSKMMAGINYLSNAEKRTRGLLMGGSYKDSEDAAQMRRQAILEMSGAVTPSRRLLGREAYLMHR